MTESLCPSWCISMCSSDEPRSLWKITLIRVAWSTRKWRRTAIKCFRRSNLWTSQRSGAKWSRTRKQEWFSTRDRAASAESLKSIQTFVTTTRSLAIGRGAFCMGKEWNSAWILTSFQWATTLATSEKLLQVWAIWVSSKRWRRVSPTDQHCWWSMTKRYAGRPLQIRLNLSKALTTQLAKITWSVPTEPS